MNENDFRSGMDQAHSESAEKMPSEENKWSMPLPHETEKPVVDDFSIGREEVLKKEKSAENVNRNENQSLQDTYHVET